MLEREAPHPGEDATDEFEFEEEITASPNPKLVWEGEEGQRERGSTTSANHKSVWGEGGEGGGMTPPSRPESPISSSHCSNFSFF